MYGSVLLTDPLTHKLQKMKNALPIHNIRTTRTSLSLDREDKLDVLERRCVESGLKTSDIWWYADLRRYGSVPHAGEICTNIHSDEGNTVEHLHAHEGQTDVRTTGRYTGRLTNRHTHRDERERFASTHEGKTYIRQKCT